MVCDGLLSPSDLEKVYLFRGDENYAGVSYESLKNLKTAIQKIYSQAVVSEWDLEHMPPSKWERYGLCVFPGGECSKWNSVLSEDLQKQILEWVKQGGRVFGICAGGYYCSALSEFSGISQNWIVSSRVIALFQGTCRGPLFSNQIEIVKVRWQRNNKEGYVVVIKGGEFIPHQDASVQSYEILARFVDKADPIAVVKCQQRDGGKAILSSIHWELGFKYMQSIKSSFPELTEKIDLLKESRLFRRECFEEILSQLAH